ncbi:hypothetical protein HBI08_238180 [Parastagonospora nodorum]|nr:hypothetical protein HBI08_238180 [Parastagonospora nodorum]
MANQQNTEPRITDLVHTLHELDERLENRRPEKDEEAYSENGVCRLVTSLFKDIEDLKDPEATWRTWLKQAESDILNLKTASKGHKKDSDLGESFAERKVSGNKIKALEYHVKDARDLYKYLGVHSALALAKVQSSWNYYKHPARRARLIRAAMKQTSGAITSDRRQSLPGFKRAREESLEPSSNKRAHASPSEESPGVPSLIDLLNSMDHLSIAIVSSLTWSMVRNSSDYAHVTDCMFKTPIDDSTDWILGVYCALLWGVRQFPKGEVPQGASHDQPLEAIPENWQSTLKFPKRWLIYMPAALPASSWESSCDCICYFRIGEQGSLFLPSSRIRERDEMTPNWQA